ncbi:enoyl-CoA hydratase/isomerase family protein [Rhodoplanes sp.]|uniref:enoyl-CoA hydratase/isomerase family protein n=1 Tax=Rhodoplanes sp. TaxID=1968906 RepID=UPI0025CD3099|nr:enoyl-CoA hydratase/isomerase family protein [Rhodoplanes sp.]
MRAGPGASLAAAQGDPAVAVMLIRCAGRTFVAGADISELGRPPLAPFLHDVVNAIECSPKPVVAALHGTALGGGLEIALGCHYRVAVPGTRMGLPGSSSGLIPGAGGTQRLPRLVGPDKAFAVLVIGTNAQCPQKISAKRRTPTSFGCADMGCDISLMQPKRSPATLARG